MLNGRKQYVVRTLHICAYSLHRKELTRGHLLQRGCTKHIVHANHSQIYRLFVADVSDIELYFRILQHVSHIILLLLITREDANFLNITVEKTAENCISERTRTACN